MTELKDYVTIKEGASLTHKSVTTIRRFVRFHKDLPNDVIRITLNKTRRPLYKINSSYLISYFELTQKKKDMVNSECVSHQPSKSTLLKRYMYYRNAYYTARKSINIVVFCTLLILGVMFVMFFYYMSILEESYEKDKKHLLAELKMQEEEIKNIYKKDGIQEQQIAKLQKLIDSGILERRILSN
jgi:hypothetical protein